MRLEEAQLNEWIDVEPVAKPYTDYHYYCPWCDRLLYFEKDSYGDREDIYCECGGYWRLDYRGNYRFQRCRPTQAEREDIERKKQAAVEKRAARQREKDLETYRRMKAELEADA